MAFDPDEYLNEKGTSSTAKAEFDPDAYLSETEEQEAPFDPDAYLAEVEAPAQPTPPVGTSFFEEVAAIPQALRQAVDQPTEAMAETATVLGMPALGETLRGAVEAPEGYVPAAQRLVQPQEGEFQVAGFAPQYIPRAAVEQAGQIVGAIATSAIGRAVGGLAGSTLGPKGAVAGAVAGQFLGPALFEMGQIVGPAARERAANQGREEPNTDDLAWAWGTAAGSGALNAIGAKYLPNGDKLASSLGRRIAESWAAESTTEGAQELLQQVGQTFLTEQGLELKPKEAIGAALVAGPAAAGATVIAAPFTQTPEAKAKSAAETKVVAEQAAPVAPETAQVVSEQANQVIAEAQAEETAETPDQRLARLRQEAKAGAEITLEEETAIAQENAPQAQARITEREGQAAQPVETPAGTRVEAAAYQAPDGTVYFGADHLEAMGKARDAGKIDQAEIDTKQETTSRETPEFGFATNAEPFVSRDQAEQIGKVSGQVTVEQPATGKLHSNEVVLDAFPSGFPAQPVTPTPEAPPVAPVAPVEPVVPEGAPAQPAVTEVAPEVKSVRQFKLADVEAPTNLEGWRALRNERISAERQLLQDEIGLTPEQAETLHDLYIVRNSDNTERWVKRNLSPEQVSKFEAFDEGPFNQRGGPVEFLEYDSDFNPEFLDVENDAPSLANAIVQAFTKGKPEQGLNDKWIYAVGAIQKLEAIGGSRKDISDALTQQARRVAGSEGDAEFWYRERGKEINETIEAFAPNMPAERGAAPAAVAPTPELAAPTPTAEPPALAPLRRVARAEQAPEDVPSLVEAGLVEVYKDQPVLTDAGLAALPEAERPRLTPEARKIQIDTGSNEVVAEAIAKNLRIGVDQVGADVRMPAGWTLDGDIYVPPAPQEVAPTPVLTPKIEATLRNEVITDFESRSKQHKQFSEGLNKAVAANSLTEDGAVLLREVFKDADPKLLGLGTISINSRRRYLGYAIYGVGTQLSENAIDKALDGRFGKNMTPEVMAQVVAHEIGHHGYNSLLTKKERALIGSIFTKLGKQGREDFFSKGTIAEPFQVKYHAKNQHEFFAQSFAEYVFSNKLPDPEIKPLFDRIVQKLKEAFQTLMNRNANIEQLVPLYEKLIGAPAPEVRESRVARDPEVQKAAQDLKAGTIDREEYQRIVDMRMPLRKFEAVPTPANNEDMLRGLGERKAGDRLKKDLIQNPEAIAEGTVLEARLDIPAYESENVWVVSLHKQRTDLQKGTAAEVVAYTPTSVLRNVTFGVTEKAAAGIAAGKPKSTIATMRGEYVPMTAEQAYELANTNKDQWVEIGMNPVRHSYFYDKDTQTPVESAEEVVQVGGMVLAKNPVFGKREDYLYSLREAQPTVGMTTDAVRARLEALGFGVEGMIRIVEDPQAAFEGRTIIQDGKAVRIELNASALNDNAAIDRVLNHEFAEAANADGALNKLVERLTTKEKKEINDAITRLGYEENVRTTEEAARAIEALAAGWKGRGFFERAVARVEAWGSKLGLKLTRRAAEYIAARNLSDVNAGFKAAYEQSINVTTESREARRDYQADADSYKINDLSKIRKVLNLSNIEDGIVKFLSRDLLDAKWAKIPVANDATTHGHCWVAAEAAYHILGGKGKDWEHRTLNNKGWPEGLDAGETHHFIQNKKTGEIIDPTRSQFGNVSIPYGNSIFGGAFMGKTAESPSIRAKALLHRIAAGEPRVEIRESRREPAPTFTDESPEAKTLSTMRATMEKVDAASEAKGGKPETQKVSEIAANWMESGGDERALQDAITENTNLSPVNAAKVAKVIAKQYDKQQQIAEAVLETEAGVTLEGLPEGMEIPKDVDPNNKRTVLQRVIDATTGVRVKPVILQVPEKTALKEQIQLKARETREAKKAQQETADAVVEAIKALELRGPMRAKQAQALAKRAAKVLWTSDKSLENFMAYAERVMANTNYDADLREAKAAQKRAKELSKRDSIAAPQRFVLEAIGNVGINLLNDPREFADVVNHYLRSFKPVVSEAYVVVPDSEMESYLSMAEDEVVSAKAEFDVEDNEKLAEKYGVSVNDLQRFLDAEDIMDALEDYAKREAIEGILNEKSANVKEALKGVDTTILRADQRKLIDAMKVIDVKSLDSAEKQAYVRIGNNIIFNNNQTNGAEFFVATAKGQQAARDLAKNTEAMTKNKAWANILPSLGSRKAKKLLKSWASELQSIADTFRNAFGKEAMTVFYEAMGMVDLDLGFTQAARTLEEIQEKMASFYNRLDKKYKGAARTQDGILSEGIVAYLIQNVPAKGEADSLAQRIGLMQQNIAELRKSGDEDKIQMADRIQQLIQRLDGDTVDQMLSNLKREYPANYDSLMWLKDELFPQYKDFLKFSDENFNDQANNYNTPNYLPIVYSNASPALDLLQGKKKYYDNLSSSPKQSSYTIKRSDYTQLPMGSDGRTPKEISLNLRKNAYNSLSDQITRAYTNPARQRISSFLKTPEAEEALGGKANLDFFADRIERLMGSRERRGSFNEGFFGKAVDVIANLGRDIGTRIALAGSYQLIRQPADQVTVAVGATGRADLMAEHLAPRSIQTARPVLDLFSIGRRGDASSGYKYINQMEGAQSRLERYYTEGNWVKAKEAATRFADKFMAPLKVSDFTVAAATWMTFYRAYLAKNGIKFTTWEDAANLIKSDDAGHKRAAAYAENMTDIYQGSSDPTKMAVFAQKGKTGSENLLKAILVPFNSFGVQFRARVSSDLTEIFTKSGDWKGKAIAVKDLSATIGGTVMFGLAKRFVLPAITYGGIKILYGIFGVDVEEPDEEKQKEEFDQKWRQLQGDIISTMVVGGFGQMIESYTIDGMNYFKYMIDTANESESVLDDDGEIMSFNEYAKERAPFYRYRSFDNAMSLGILDIGMDQAKKSILNTKMVMTPDEMDRFTPEEQRFLYAALVSDWLYLGGFNDADFARMWDKGRRDMINARKEEEKELQRIRSGR